jgi:AraC-like DNA-binding protein
MILGEKMKSILESTGYYISLPGGSVNPYIIKDNNILFELITAGAVYDPSAEETLRGRGWIFAHVPGQQTLSRSEVDGHYECMTMLFKVTEEDERNIWPRSFSWGEEDRAVSFAHEMLYSFHHTRMDRSILGDLIWSQLRFRLENYKRQKSRKAIPPRVLEVMSYIDRYYTDALGIEELAKHVKLSASHLHSRFKEYVGLTPHQYIIRRRMQAARHTLATTDIPIKAVAVDTGYINTESFCRAFKQYFGITAAGYRRKYMIY